MTKPPLLGSWRSWKYLVKKCTYGTFSLAKGIHITVTFTFSSFSFLGFAIRYILPLYELLWAHFSNLEKNVSDLFNWYHRKPQVILIKKVSTRSYKLPMLVNSHSSNWPFALAIWSKNMRTWACIELKIFDKCYGFYPLKLDVLFVPMRYFSLITDLTVTTKIK